MTRFTDYAQRLRNTQTPFNGGLVQITPKPAPATTPAPTVDTQNAIGSLANMLGPTPEEREEMEAKALKNKSKMQAWAGLFDGLRQLGNLYAVSKGAKPQQFTDNPYQQIEANYQADKQRAKDLEDYRRQYAQQIYNIRRQSEQDQIQREAHKANMEYKKAQEENNTRKVDIQMFKAISDAEYKNATLQQKEKILEIREKLANSDISLKEAQEQLARVKANAGGFAPQREYVTHSSSDSTNQYGETTHTETTTRRGGGNAGNGKTVVYWYER